MAESKSKLPMGLSKGALIAGKYRLGEVMARGAMGVVIEAEHEQLGQRVAIKFLLPDTRAADEDKTRFLREARAAARIGSEHVVRVMDVDGLADGTPYIVMEYLEGEDLSAILARSGPLPPATAIDYVLQACDGLAEAHEYAIIHRDIKPANLFLARKRRGPAIVKVVDFGISKMRLGNADTGLTKETTLMGSPLYMSPEQMTCSRDVDSRTDIWSMGVTLYELLAGKPPFYASTLPKLFAQVLHDTPKPLSSLRPEVTPEIEQIVARCLAKDPDSRFPSISDLAQTLVPFVSSSTLNGMNWLRSSRAWRDPPAGPISALAQEVGSRSAADPKARGPIEELATALPDGSATVRATLAASPRSKAMAATVPNQVLDTVELTDFDRELLGPDRPSVSSSPGRPPVSSDLSSLSSVNLDPHDKPDARSLYATVSGWKRSLSESMNLEAFRRPWRGLLAMTTGALVIFALVTRGQLLGERGLASVPAAAPAPNTEMLVPRGRQGGDGVQAKEAMEISGSAAAQAALPTASANAAVDAGSLPSQGGDARTGPLGAN